MEILVALGAIMVAVGLGGLGYCIAVGYAIKRDKPDADTVRKRLNQLIAVNFGSVALAGMGLAMLVIGLVF